jgi:hypothetical protein
MHSNPIEWSLTPSVLTTVVSPHRRGCSGSLLGVVENLWTCYSQLVEKFLKLLALSFIYFFISHFAHQQNKGKYLILLLMHLFTLHWKELFVIHAACCGCRKLMSKPATWKECGRKEVLRSPGSYLDVFLEKLRQNSHLFIFLYPQHSC